MIPHLIQSRGQLGNTMARVERLERPVHGDKRLVSQVVLNGAGPDRLQGPMHEVQVRHEGRVVVRALGPLPAPSPKELRRQLDRAGERGTDVALELVPEERVELPGR